MTQDHLFEECACRRLRIERFGVGWRLHGKGVDILARRLTDFHPTDFLPFR